MAGTLDAHKLIERDKFRVKKSLHWDCDPKDEEILRGRRDSPPHCKLGEHSPAFLVHDISGNFWEVQICPCECHRNALGKMVRELWVSWAKEHPSPKPSWLEPYENLSEVEKEADRQIGEGLLERFVEWLR